MTSLEPGRAFCRQAAAPGVTTIADHRLKSDEWTYVVVPGSAE